MILDGATSVLEGREKPTAASSSSARKLPEEQIGRARGAVSLMADAARPTKSFEPITAWARSRPE